MDLPKEIYGVDFSGAVDAGTKIWIAGGTGGRASLAIEHCVRGEDLPGSGKAREACLTALASFVERHPDSATGFDFPFGLPGLLIRQRNWKAFVSAFPRRYKDPDHFRETCFKEAGRQEVRRAADVSARTPFASYNRRVYKQTYFGIREILRPLVRKDSARVLPMQEALAGKPWIMEICPASTLKACGLYHIHYKGREARHRKGRERILESLSKAVPFRLGNHGLAERVVENAGGDALDSVIAAAGTFQALKRKDLFAPKDADAWNLEGYVYA